jgi:hypothetical protein
MCDGPGQVDFAYKLLSESPGSEWPFAGGGSLNVDHYQTPHSDWLRSPSQRRTNPASLPRRDATFSEELQWAFSIQASGDGGGFVRL